MRYGVPPSWAVFNSFSLYVKAPVLNFPPGARHCSEFDHGGVSEAVEEELETSIPLL